ncbi:MAG: hypothetical protein IMZ53_06245 [Thermoplasmata archaeon]|nr:hypothetical protein [Thermoplasmata archaeon]
MSDYWKKYFSPENDIEGKLKEKFSEMVSAFKKETEDHIKQVLGDLETEYLACLFEDTGQNLRNVLMECMMHESNRELRDKIFTEHREEIINEKIAQLETDLALEKRINNDLRNRY